MPAANSINNQHQGVNVSYTSRGGAVNQKKDWEPLALTSTTTFVHFGSAPFAPGNTGLLLKFSKEICDVQQTASTKWILAFPVLDAEYAGLYPPNQLVIPKAASLLWSEDEMPNGFLIQIPPGTTVYTKGAKLDENNEVGFDFDVIFKTMLWAQYARDGKRAANLKNVWNGPAI